MPALRLIPACEIGGLSYLNKKPRPSRRYGGVEGVFGPSCFVHVYVSRAAAVAADNKTAATIVRNQPALSYLNAPYFSILNYGVAADRPRIPPFSRPKVFPFASPSLTSMAGPRNCSEMVLSLPRPIPEIQRHGLHAFLIEHAGSARSGLALLVFPVPELSATHLSTRRGARKQPRPWVSRACCSKIPRVRWSSNPRAMVQHHNAPRPGSGPSPALTAVVQRILFQILSRFPSPRAAFLPIYAKRGLPPYDPVQRAWRARANVGCG